MSNRARNTLGWWVIAACTAMTIGAIATAGTGASARFAAGTWVLAIIVAFLSRHGRSRHDAQDAPASPA